MSDDVPKKDLTNLVEYSKSHADEIPDNEAMAEQAIEPIEAFENLDDFAKSNPVAELPSPEGTNFPISESSDSSGLELSTLSEPSITPDESFASPPDDELPPNEPPPSVTEAFATTPRAAAAPPPARTIAPAAVPAAYPFSVLITGTLQADEQEKLLDLLERENYGIRKEDLEPQFRGGKILIPRISEYAGILLIQTLRTANVIMQIAPSDEIFSTPDTHTTSEDPLLSAPEPPQVYLFDATSDAESIVISTDSALPNSEIEKAIDVVTASAGLKSYALELRRSAEYNDLVENLKRELRQLAHRQGADAITGFQLRIDRLDLPSSYRISVTGTAVRTKR